MKSSVICILAVLSSIPCRCEKTTMFFFGGVLSSEKHINTFKQIVRDLNDDTQILPSGITVDEATMLMNPNPIRTALQICQNLIKLKVYAIVVSHPSIGQLSPAAVSYTSGFYHIPVIGITSRDSAFSDKNIHVSFLRTVPPYSHQADVWVEMLKHFSYRNVVFIHSSDTDGRSILVRFQNIAMDQGDGSEGEIQIEKIVEYEVGVSSISSQLWDVLDGHSRVFLLYASKRDAEVIFRDASEANMTQEGYVWIVTEQALNASNVPEGVLGLELTNADNETAHIHDSLYILGNALRKMYHSENISEAPEICSDTGSTWETGGIYFNYIQNETLFDGETGKVAFDENGDRKNAEYKIINVHRGHRRIDVGSYIYDKRQKHMKLDIDDDAIIWPGRKQKRPQGYEIPTHLRVITIIEKPFVYARRIDAAKDMCDLSAGEIPCSELNSTVEAPVMFCCRGFCMDLLQSLAERINFTYNLSLSYSGEFGSFSFVNNTGKKEWTGLIGELVNDRADMIVAPLTINPQRAQVIEFSKPFKYQGITILEKKQPKTSTLVSFLQPFRDTLWILVMVSVHVVALVLYLLDRFSPFGRFRLANNDGTEEDALNLSSAIWFAWGVLLNSGIGEGTPRSFSARVLGMVWAGFAMIIVASYTANLAAFLVLDRPKTSLTGIHDARLRNPSENFTYATVKGSSVDMYFKRQVELSNMYRTMEGNNYKTAEEAIEAVKDGRLNAFIWDSSRLEHEAAQDCNLVTAGELFGRSGYGIALKKGSPWADSVTLSILYFHESNLIEDLDNKWILQGNINNCIEDEKTPATLGLKNMAGVFILVAAGIVGGIGLIIIEIIYKKHQTRNQRKLELARHAADKWRGTIEKRKLLREGLVLQRRSKSNGISDKTSASLEILTPHSSHHIANPTASTQVRGNEFHARSQLRSPHVNRPRVLPLVPPPPEHLVM